MAFLRNLTHGLLALFRKKRLDHDLDEELQGFVEAAAEKKIREGMKPEEAWRASRAEMGSMASVKDDVSHAGWESILERTWQDLRYGARTLRKNPGFTFVAVLTLALGIGINAGIFAILNAAVLRPLPLARSGELVSIYQSIRGPRHRSIHGSLAMSSYPEYQEFRNHNHVFSGLVAYAPFVEATLNIGKPRQIMGTITSCNYFEVLEVRAAIGRTFTESECSASGSGAVAVLSNDLWRSDFGSDPSIIGKVIHLNRVPLTVIGIAPGGFGGTEVVPSAFWAPVSMQSSLMHVNDFMPEPFMAWLVVTGRLKPGVSIAQARADLAVMTARFDQLQPGKITTLSIAPSTLASDPEMRTVVLGVGAVILFAVGLVLLIACVNIANLLLARAAVRGKEIAVRLAIGARRSRIIRQLLTESLLLALIGGFLGTLTAFWVPATAVHFLLSHLPPDTPPLVVDPHPDFSVLLYALVLTFITGIAFGLAPALRSSRADLTLAMKQDMRNSEGRRGRKAFLGHTLVGIQVAGCMVLLSAAALLLKGLYRAQTSDPGFAMKDVFVTTFDLRAAGYDKQRVAGFQNQLRDRLADVPAFDSVAQSEVTPLGNQHDITNFTVPERGRDFDTEYNHVGSNYFSVLAIPIIRGRNFTQAEERTNAAVAIVTESTARQFWPGKDPIGKTLRGFGKVLDVIGIAGDAQVANLGQSDTRYVYLTPDPDSQYHFSFIVHSAAGFTSTENSIHKAVAHLDSDLPVSVSRIEDNLEFWRAPSRMVSMFSGVLGGLALFLAAMGIYGMAAYNVSRRVREIGIRMALGANAGNVLFLVLRQAIRPVIIGAVIGAGGCVAVAGILSSLLYGVSPYDPFALFSAGAFFLLVALLASYIPARRAMKVDPTVALRAE